MSMATTAARLLAIFALLIPLGSMAAPCQSKFDLDGGCDILAAIPYQGYGAFGAKVYRSTAPGTALLNRVLIIVPGFNPAPGGTSAGAVLEIFNSPSQPAIDRVRSKGTDVIVVDFKDAGDKDYIQNNAFALVQLLNFLNSQRGGVGQPHVILGASMGGLISRYALTYMESRNIQHNVGTYISYDVPNRDANIPLAAQRLVDFLEKSTTSAKSEADKLAAAAIPAAVGVAGALGPLDLLNPASPVSPFAPFVLPAALYATQVAIDQSFGPAIASALLLKTSLNSPSARQMLISHYAFGKDDELKRNFRTELSQMGQYPRKTRNVGFTNGSVDGNSYAWPLPGDDLIVPYSSTVDIFAGYTQSLALTLKSAAIRIDGAPTLALSGRLAGPRLEKRGDYCEKRDPIIRSICIIYVPPYYVIGSGDYYTDVYSSSAEQNSLDNAPGSWGLSPSSLVSSFNASRGNLAAMSSARAKASDYISFVPTYSALDIDIQQLGYSPAANFFQFAGGGSGLKNLTPFDQIYYPTQPSSPQSSLLYGLNGPHLKVTPEKAEQLLNEITASPSSPFVNSLSWLPPILDLIIN